MFAKTEFKVQINNTLAYPEEQRFWKDKLKDKLKMKKYDVVVIGGGPAGVACAISAHNTYPDKKML